MQAEALRLLLLELEGLLEEYAPMMSALMEKTVDIAIKYSTTIAEVS